MGGNMIIIDDPQKPVEAQSEALRNKVTDWVSNTLMLANDYADTYAPFIEAAVRDVGHNYGQVAKWLTRERIPSQRDGRWKAQSVKNQWCAIGV
jgi:hypothetical protein